MYLSPRVCFAFLLVCFDLYLLLTVVRAGCTLQIKKRSALQSNSNVSSDCFLLKAEGGFAMFQCPDLASSAIRCNDCVPEWLCRL